VHLDDDMQLFHCKNVMNPEGRGFKGALGEEFMFHWCYDCKTTLGFQIL